jgi:hypothetical protein
VSRSSVAAAPSTSARRIADAERRQAGRARGTAHDGTPLPLSPRFEQASDASAADVPRISPFTSSRSYEVDTSGQRWMTARSSVGPVTERSTHLARMASKGGGVPSKKRMVKDPAPVIREINAHANRGAPPENKGLVKPMIRQQTHKRCTKCSEWLPFSAFPANKRIWASVLTAGSAIARRRRTGAIETVKKSTALGGRPTARTSLTTTRRTAHRRRRPPDGGLPALRLRP